MCTVDHVHTHASLPEGRWACETPSYTENFLLFVWCFFFTPTLTSKTFCIFTKSCLPLSAGTIPLLIFTNLFPALFQASVAAQNGGRTTCTSTYSRGDPGVSRPFSLLSELCLSCLYRKKIGWFLQDEVSSISLSLSLSLSLLSLSPSLPLPIHLLHLLFLQSLLFFLI